MKRGTQKSIRGVKEPTVESNNNKEQINSKYLDWNDILGYNKPINMVLTPRSYGKTYGCVKHCIKWALRDLDHELMKSKSMFIYVRRYKDDMPKWSEYFVPFLENNEFPGWTIYYDKGEIKAKRVVDVDREKGTQREEIYTIGFPIPLSIWQKQKGANYLYVKNIVYDEFIKEEDGSRYLKNEPSAFMNFLKTVFRRREGWRVFLLGNHVSQLNPYFIYFNIYANRHTKTLVKGDILYYNKWDLTFVEQEQMTTIGKITKDTPEGKMAMEGTFLGEDENHYILSKRHEKIDFRYCNLEVQGTLLGVWVDRGYRVMYVSRFPHKRGAVKWTFTDTFNIDNDYIEVKNLRRNTPAGILLDATLTRRVFFSDLHTKKLFSEYVGSRL